MKRIARWFLTAAAAVSATFAALAAAAWVAGDHAFERAGNRDNSYRALDIQSAGGVLAVAFRSTRSVRRLYRPSYSEPVVPAPDEPQVRFHRVAVAAGGTIPYSRLQLPSGSPLAPRWPLLRWGSSSRAAVYYNGVIEGDRATHRKTPTSPWERPPPDVVEQGVEFDDWRWFAVPYWLVIVVALPLPISAAVGSARRRRARRRERNGRCPACGYDLRATPGRCPECGCAFRDGPRGAMAGMLLGGDARVVES